MQKIKRRNLFFIVASLVAGSASADLFRVKKPRAQGLNLEKMKKARKKWKPNGQLQDRLECIEEALGWRE